jgi:hypothetical protein
MSDPEHFLARWSRRKRAATDAADAPQAVDAPTPAVAPVAPVDRTLENKADRGESTPVRGVAGDTEAGEPALDLARLPPIESITAATDIRAFLQPGVPAELARAALRRAWAADPAIRDFVGLAENAWDFTAPNAVAGFGPLDMTDELRRRLLEMVGHGPAPAAETGTDPTAPTAQSAAPGLDDSTESVAPAAAQPIGEGPEHVGQTQEETVKNDSVSRDRDGRNTSGKVHIAMQQETENMENRNSIARRPHGGALPE